MWVHTHILNFCRMCIAFFSNLFFKGGFYVQNSRYLTFTLANKNQLVPAVFIASKFQSSFNYHSKKLIVILSVITVVTAL